MSYIPKDYVQLQRSVSWSDSRCLKLVREIKVSKIFAIRSSRRQERKERRPNEVLALGMISEIHPLERVLRVGVAIVTSELR